MHHVHTIVQVLRKLLDIVGLGAADGHAGDDNVIRMVDAALMLLLARASPGGRCSGAGMNHFCEASSGIPGVYCGEINEEMNKTVGGNPVRKFCVSQILMGMKRTKDQSSVSELWENVSETEFLLCYDCL